MRIISIVNQKGGVCKSTTAQAIAEILNLQHKKALLVDLDPQGNLSFAVGANTENVITVYNVLKKEVDTQDILQVTPSSDILPANILLSGADMEFTSTGREYLLKEAIHDIKQRYKYIIIDCPPALNILTINALVASDYVVIPSLADVFSLQGMGQLNNTIQSIIKYCNPNLKIAGILLTKFTHRNNLSQIIKNELENVTRQMNTKVFSSNIRNAVALQEAQLQRECLFEYAQESTAIQDYINLVSELEEIIK